MQLLKSQKSSLFDFVVKKGFSPAQFEIEPVTGAQSEFVEASSTEPYTQVSFRGTPYYFRFEAPLGRPSVVFSPGEDTFSANIECDTWNTQLTYFTIWLDLLRREISTPDKWADFLAASEKLSWEKTEEGNTQFSYDEVQTIERAASTAKQQLRQLGLVPEQLRIIESKLDYISDRAKSFGRIDWKNLFVGTLVSLVVQYSIPLETAKLIWKTVGEAFKQVILIALH
jgi:hypothetical protein